MTLLPAPTVAEERARALHDAAESWKSSKGISADEYSTIVVPDATSWRRNGPVLSAVFFVLTIVAVAAFFVLCHLMSLPAGIVTAVFAIGAAEMLIRRRRFFGTGIESALWITGTCYFIIDLPSSGRPEAILVFAAAAALCGWRLRHALFGTLAAVLVVAYAAVKYDDVWPPAMIGTALALGAALALTREWRRRTTEWLFVGLTIAMPPTSYLASAAVRRFGFSNRGFHTNITLAIELAMTAVVLLILGVRHRHRALLASSAISFALAAIELHELQRWSVEAKLIAAGILLVAGAAGIARALRGHTQGFVVTPVAAAYEEWMQIAGAISVVHPSGAAPHTGSGPDVTQAHTTDSSFGGAGAGGDT